MTPVGSLLIGAPRLLSATLKLVPTMGVWLEAKQKLDVPPREDFLCCSLFLFRSWQKCTFSAQLLWWPSLFLSFTTSLGFFFSTFKQQRDAASASVIVAAKRLMYQVEGWMDGCDCERMLALKKEKKSLFVELNWESEYKMFVWVRRRWSWSLWINSVGQRDPLQWHWLNLSSSLCWLLNYYYYCTNTDTHTEFPSASTSIQLPPPFNSSIPPLGFLIFSCVTHTHTHTHPPIHRAIWE